MSAERSRTEAFNEWMRRYLEDPEQFAREFQDVGTFLSESGRGEIPTYGAQCNAYLAQLESGE